MISTLRHLALTEPDRLAIDDGTRQLTYRQLVDRVSGLAAELVAHPTPGPAALLVGHRVESFVAIFASIWAGRTVVPLDPAEPTERLEALIARVQPVVVIDTVDGRAGTFAELPLIDGVSERSGFVEPQHFEPDDFCFLLFTSGSTGVPKCVPRTVAQSNRFVGEPPVFGVGRIGVCLAPHFSGGLFSALHSVVKGQFVRLFDVRSLTATEFAEQVRIGAVTRLIITPSLARLLGRTCRDASGFETVTDLFLMGEPVDWNDVTDIRALGGPSATISVTMAASESLGTPFVMTIPPEMPIGTGRVPLGRAVRPERIRLEPVGDGDATQLVLRDGTIAAYFDHNEQAAGQFGVDPDGVRFWRSGDLVELAADGEYYHRGRIDDMVKINGRLIEPAEIEAALSTIPAIERSVVLPRTLQSGRTVVVAHLQAPSDLDLAAVRRTLRRTLPTHLVPAFLVRHDALPLTARGKLDRAALVAAAVPIPPLSPRTRVIDPLEFAVSGTVESILELAHLDPDDDIWDLGCDSFAAVQISSALSTELAGGIDPNDLMRARSVRQMCDLIRAGGQVERTHIVTMNDGGQLPPIFLVAGAGSPALSFYPLSVALGPEQPIVVYEQYGLHQDVEPDSTVAAVAERHVRDLVRRRPEGLCIVAGYSIGGQIAHAMAAMLLAEGREVRLISLDGMRRHYVPRRRRVLVRRLRDLGRALRRRGGLLRAARSRLTVAPIGTTARYDLFYRHALRIASTYEPQPLDTPVLHVAPPSAKSLERWRPEPRLSLATISGDHFTMLHRPYVDEVAAAIRDFLA